LQLALHAILLAVQEEAQLQPSQVGGLVELDCLVKDFNIAAEYQGTHHFFDIIYYGQRDTQLQVDYTKAVACGLAGVHLVEIPFYIPAPSSAQLIKVFSQYQ